MSSDDPAPRAGPTDATPQRTSLPMGYRQGVISAITVVLGFSLLFLRFWGFELEGEWDAMSIVSAFLMGISILGQLVTLWRSLQIEDDEPAEYRKTLRWFAGSTILLLLGLALSAVAFFLG
jgi:hypothetical protein